MRFLYPDALFLLAGLIPLTGVFILFLARRRQSLRRMGNPGLISRITPEKARYKHTWKFTLAALTYIALVLALANPQVGRNTETVKQQGIDIIIALDVSNSMLAEDEKPSRLARAKQFVSRFLDKLSGDRVGLILFAGSSYLQSPVTSDYPAVKTLLRTADPSAVSTQGTDIGGAILMASKAFDRAGSGSRALLLITDGEDLQGSALSDAEDAANEGLHIYTIGIGSPQGAPIPVTNPGGAADGFKKDKEGNTVVTRLDEEVLRQVSEAGAGRYLRLQQGPSEINALLDEMNKLDKQEFEDRSFSDYEDQFQWCVLAALLLICMEYFVSERRSGLFSDWKIFRSSSSTLPRALTLLLLFSPLLSQAQLPGSEPHYYLRKGDKAYTKGDFGAAAENYRKSSEAGASAQAHFNQGDAFYRQKRYPEAKAQFEAAIKGAADPSVKAGALHNLGLTLQQMQKYEESVEAYKEALRMNPGDDDTRYNLSAALRQLQQKQQQENQQQQQNQEQQNEEQEQNPADNQDQEPPKQQQQPRQAPRKMSDEELKRMLDALQAEEDKTREKLQQRRAQARKSNPEKDW